MRGYLGVVLAAGVWVAASALPCEAQTTPPPANPAPCRVEPEPEPCGTSPAATAKPNATEKFPFPGSAGASSSSAAPSAPNLNGVPDAPETPEQTPSAPATGKKDFPFPGDANKPDASGASSSSSSSSAGDDDPAADADSAGLKDKGTEGAQTKSGRHILHRVNPPATKLQTDDEREAEDLSIAHYYVQSGNLEGAYLRSQDAVKITPDDPAAHFMLAEIAMKLNKRDEAIAEYNACLKLDPDDKQEKASRKALARLKP